MFSGLLGEVSLYLTQISLAGFSSGSCMSLMQSLPYAGRFISLVGLVSLRDQSYFSPSKLRHTFYLALPSTVSLQKAILNAKILVEKTSGKSLVSKAVLYILFLTKCSDACWLHCSESCFSTRHLLKDSSAGTKPCDMWKS